MPRALAESRRPAARISTREARGIVSVPVLSKAAVFAVEGDPIADIRAGRTPIAEGRPADNASASGAARATAHGHVTIRTAMADGNARAGSRRIHHAAVAADATRTAATSQPATRSASCAQRGRL